MYMHPILNGFQNRTISLYSSKIVDKIYCSSDKVVTVHLV
jgi:hypothetical protein